MLMPVPRSFVQPLHRVFRLAAVLCTTGAGLACGSGHAPEPVAGTAVPVYNQQTGRLEELVSDRDGDGKVETRAFMDGTRIVRVEIDRNADGRADRIETYAPQSAGAAAPLLEQAEEMDAVTGSVTRRELYEGGRVQRVEEDTDGDGKVDKWETYANGRLVQVDMDLSALGRPDRRLVYGPGGGVDRVESDPDGDGVFESLDAGRVPSTGGERGGRP